jgi:hypothetical protein
MKGFTNTVQDAISNNLRRENAPWSCQVSLD